MSLPASLYQRVLSSMAILLELVMSQRTTWGTTTSAAVYVSGGMPVLDLFIVGYFSATLRLTFFVIYIK